MIFVGALALLTSTIIHVLQFRRILRLERQNRNQQYTLENQAEAIRKTLEQAMLRIAELEAALAEARAGMLEAIKALADARKATESQSKTKCPEDLPIRSQDAEWMTDNGINRHDFQRWSDEMRDLAWSKNVLYRAELARIAKREAGEI